MQKKYVVALTSEEHETLRKMVSVGKGSAQRLTHARILLKADIGTGGPGWLDAQISEALEVGTATIERVRKQFVEEGLEAALERRRSRRTYLRKLDGEAEAHLVALTCGAPPEGRGRWTLRLLADRMVELKRVDHISHETVRQVLKKTNLSLG